MKYYLTYEDALQICEAYNHENFYKTETRIQGYKVVTFNYFMCAPEWFETPLKDRPEVNAYDMRGVTFVFNTDGTLYARYLMLPKFFNVNQIESTSIENLKIRSSIKYVTVKEDGSLVTFMRLPNYEVFAKTQGGFTNEQCYAAMQIYKQDPNVAKFVDNMLDVHLTPLFEYVSYDNRIVLKYDKKELRLLGVRVNDHRTNQGDFIPAVDMKKTVRGYKIPRIKEVDIDSLDELMERVKEEKNIEGYVVYFNDGSIVKFKTHWYFISHGIRTENIFREDYIIKNYLNDTLDDVTQELNRIDDKDAFDFIETVIQATNNWKNHIDNLTDELVSLYDGDFAKFATLYNKRAFFNLGRIKVLTPEDYKEKRNEFMIFNIRRLNMARNIIEKFKNK